MTLSDIYMILCDLLCSVIFYRVYMLLYYSAAHRHTVSVMWAISSFYDFCCFWCVSPENDKLSMNCCSVIYTLSSLSSSSYIRLI